jgi:hypothetical protein
VEHAVEIGSGAMIFIPSFIKIGSGIQKLMRGYIDTQTHRKTGRRSHEFTLGKQAKH